MGDKTRFPEEWLQALLDAGISCASINYRLLPASTYPVIFEDAARAVQFLRTQAAQWNFDPTNIAAGGTSAGASMALWLAFQDDMAQPQSSDPVARQSTRVTSVVSHNGPV